MKRIVAVILSSCLLLSLVSCAGHAETETETSVEATITSSEAPTENTTIQSETTTETTTETTAPQHEPLVPVSLEVEDPEKTRTDCLDPNSEIISFADENLLHALIEAGVDSNGDSQISKSEAEWTEELWLVNKGISNLDGLQYFTSLRSLQIPYNQIVDISPLEDLTNMCNVDISNNWIPCCEQCGISTYEVDTLEKLSQRAHELDSDYGGLLGMDRQCLNYDENQFAVGVDIPTIKIGIVLFAEEDFQLFDGTEYVDIKYSFSDELIEYYRHVADSFGRFLEKMGGYRFYVDIDYNVIEEPITGQLKYDWDVYTYTIDPTYFRELEDYRNQFDTSMCIVYIPMEYASATGTGGFEYERGICFLDSFPGYTGFDLMNQWDMSAEEIYTYIDNGGFSEEVELWLHEFIHTIEVFGIWQDIPTAELHGLLAMDTYRNDMAVYSAYLQGVDFECTNYDGNSVTGCGLTDELLWNRPTQVYPKAQRVDYYYLSLGSDDDENET